LGAICAVPVTLTLFGVLPPRSWLLVLLLVPTFALDAVDGAVARRTGTATARGARWDMEVDSVVLLVACLAVVPYAPWALVIGLARYLYGVAGRLWPALRSALPFSQRRRLIGGFQGVAVVLALTPIVPIWLAQVITGVALALQVFSFGRDLRYQQREFRRVRTVSDQSAAQ
jgi:phosphatidylglycerophosphate synthase